ncbi:hypothetical protein E4U17_000911, partial [Claviceps sp. LM77 group G4]
MGATETAAGASFRGWLTMTTLRYSMRPNRVITTATFGQPSPDCSVVTVTEEQQKNELRQHYYVDSRYSRSMGS